MADHPLFQHPGIQALFRAAARERRMQGLAGLTMMCGGLALGVFCFRQNNFLVILALILLVLGLRWLIEAIHGFRVPHPLVELVCRQPQRIVWVYSVTTALMPFGVQMFQRGDMHFRLIDGNEIVISLPIQHLKMVSHTLSRLLPHAVFGYSEEREERYRVNPQSLLRSSGEV